MPNKKIIIHLEHDTEKPLKYTLKTKGFKGFNFARLLRARIKRGYRLADVDGDPDDPLYQQIVAWLNQYKEKGKISLDLGQIRKTASKVTGAKVEDIKKQMDKTLNGWRSRFKGVLRQ